MTRSFLIALLLLAVVISAAAEERAPANVSNPPDVITQKQLTALPPHPRLLATSARWEELRSQTQTDPATADIFAALQKRADILRERGPVDYTADTHNIHAAVREAQRRILTFAIVHRLAGDTACLEAARRTMKELIAVPWPRGRFLEVAETAFALSAGYDWLHDQLSPDEREAISEKIHREALVSFVTEEDRLAFLWAGHNWNQVCHGGLVAGAITIARRDPALASRVINRSIADIPRAAAAYAPAGVYPEGPSYSGFGTTYHVLQIEALRTAFGTSADLEKFPGFLESAECLNFLTGPTGDYFNYSDNLSRRGHSGAALWFARENQRSDLARAELERVRRFAGGFDADDYRDLALLFLWWKPLPHKHSNSFTSWLKQKQRLKNWSA